MGKHNILVEIPTISPEDSFVLFERHKSEFAFPIHIHNEYELNYVAGAAGARRIIGDNISEIKDKDLVLIGGENLEHGWVNGSRETGPMIHEITIQFRQDLFSSGFITRKQFYHINKMMDAAKHGILFSDNIICKAEPVILEMTESKGFNSIILFLRLLDILATGEQYTILSHFTSKGNADERYDSRRIAKVMSYLNCNYMKDISLQEAADLVNMSQSSFSRFIKQRTGKNFINCLNDIRIGVVTRCLIEEPSRTISEIAYNAGFSNLANFNRIFKKKKGVSPHEFRSLYFKKYIII